MTSPVYGSITTAETRFARSAIHAASSSCSIATCSVASSGERDVLPGVAGIEHDGRVGHRVAGGVLLGGDDARHARELVLVELLDAVLPLPVPVDEAEDVRRQGRVRPAAGLRVDAHRLRLEQDARELGAVARDPRPDLIGDRGVEVAGQHDVLALGLHLRRELGRRVPLETEDRDELRRIGNPLLRVRSLGYAARRSRDTLVARTTVPVRS